MEEARAVILAHIDFAMLGTIADCMPLVGENRTIATLGLRQLRETDSHGLRSLLDGKTIDSEAIGFFV